MASSKRASLSSIGSIDEKKRRTRRRKLQASLCSQVEFYFSDANLRKDRFINQEIKKSADRYVPLDLVASFNKIRELTEDVGVIGKALQKSKLVEVSPDGTQIRRRKPLEEPKYNPDDCTVYVECLPKPTDIAWIQQTFKYCGNVTYVSLPRYKSTGDIKGFAFVEYETPEEAQRACQLLNNPLDDYGPPGMFPKTRKGKFVSVDLAQISLDQTDEPEEHRHHRHGNKRGSTNRDSKEEEADEHSRKHLKRRHNDKTEDSHKLKELQESNLKDKVHGERIVTESKQETGTAENEENTKRRKRKSETVDHEGKVSKKRKGHEEEDNHVQVGGGGGKERREDGQGEGDRHIGEDGKKTRKRKAEEDDVKDESQKKRKPKEEKDAVVFETVREKDESASVVQKDVRAALKIMRNKEKGVTRVDGNRKKKRFRQKKEKEEQQLFLRVLSKAEWLKLKDQYLHLQKLGLQEMKNAMRAQWRAQSHSKPAVTQEPQKGSTAPEFVEGVVLRIQSTEPIESRKELREKLDSVAPVAYVDLEDGEAGGFVRFKFQQAAEKVLSQDIAGLDTISFTLLTGDEEEKYWQKLNADRVSKLTSTSKRKKQRGKIRVMKRAEKALTAKMSSHITFND
ncbi:la-related protein 7-like [Apostichopus japonicus]|uniref:la-related protein 7-like n=1 Tax=Stichopus japonicus TaxID=307972 RepID=UPI003AB5103B